VGVFFETQCIKAHTLTTNWKRVIYIARIINGCSSDVILNGELCIVVEEKGAA